ncbi:Glutathione S-transferase 2 [Steccherinum ochraceum]|uniref:glutathione transferase n=1 Tax=Steccherinum ochraceum TaxID=92696 RepID=A0A4R0RNZ0_9APHY|nr:Glutathione S-transferase 2 [Steccherinum ochraceum]
MAHDKQFTLFTAASPLPPNGWKVAYVLNALGLSYESVYLDSASIRGPEHLKLNPNGRIPTLIDHRNGDLTIWESGAIILYLIDTYDTEHTISVADPREKAVLTQWLFFQASGQGPYFGQATWFKHYHSEKVPSAIDRYENEARRLLNVLESILRKQEYLVAGRVTAADIAFVPWHDILYAVINDEFDFEKEFPNTYKWHKKVEALDGVKQGLEARQRRVEAAENEKKKASDHSEA